MNEFRKQPVGLDGEPDPVLDLGHVHVSDRARRRRIAFASAVAACVLVAAGAVWANPGDPRPETITTADGGGTGPTMPGNGDVPATSTSGAASPSTSAPDSTTTAPSSTVTSSVATAPTPAPTTAVAPLPDGAPAATSDPVTITGTYIGAGLSFEPDPGDCDQLAHRLDAVITLDSGEAWQYRADFCGVLEGVHWSGTGPFVFTLPDGAQITGTLVSEADLPSTGEPYELVVTGGTGRWAGASGTCALTNRMRPLPSGLQEQAGEIRCTVSTLA